MSSGPQWSAEALPENLKRLRGDDSIKRTARRIGISPSYLYDLESGDAFPSRKVLNKIFKGTGWTPNDLFIVLEEDFNEQRRHYRDHLGA